METTTSLDPFNTQYFCVGHPNINKIEFKIIYIPLQADIAWVYIYFLLFTQKKVKNMLNGEKSLQ